MCCVLTARTGRALPNPGRALQSKAPAGRSSSPARQASAFGNGLGRPSKSLIEIRRNPIAFESFTPAERARRSDCTDLSELEAVCHSLAVQQLAQVLGRDGHDVEPPSALV